MHIPALDGLRGLAILLVMIFHQTLLGTMPGQLDMHFTCTFDRIWSILAGFGWCGVDLFFVLSGFLITGILYDARGKNGYFRSFYARRILRIFPLYYLVVAFCLLVLPHIHNAKSDRFGHVAGDEIWYWTYLSNFIIARKHFRHGILDVSWTLAIEEQFYLVWPAVVLLFSRKVLLWICGGLVLTAIALRTCLFYHGAHPIFIMTMTPCRMDSLAIGAALSLLARGQRGITRYFTVAKFVAAAGGALLLGYLIWQGPSWDGGSFGQCLGYSVLALFFAAILCLSLNLKPTGIPSRVLTSQFMRLLGRLSYAIYLFNFPLRAVIRDTAYGPSKFLIMFGSQMPGQLIFYAMAMTITIFAAWVSWHVWEMPFLRLKRFFPMPK